MRRLVVALSAVCLTLTVGSPAEAADTVTIKKIGTKTAPYKKTATVKPSYRRTGKVQVAKATLSVKSGRKTIRRNKTAVKLKAGKYTVTQRVTYRPYSLKSTKVRVVAKGASIASVSYVEIADGVPYVETCDVTNVTPTSDAEGTFRSVCPVVWYDVNLEQSILGNVAVSGTYAPDVIGDGLVWRDTSGALINLSSWTPEVGEQYFPQARLLSDRDLFRTRTSRVYGKARSKSKTQRLTIKKGAKPRTCATYGDFQRVNHDFDDPESYGDAKSIVTKKLHGGGKRSSFSDYGDSVIEFRDYKTCKKSASISVGFFNGYAYAKSYSD